MLAGLGSFWAAGAVFAGAALSFGASTSAGRTILLCKADAKVTGKAALSVIPARLYKPMPCGFDWPIETMAVGLEGFWVSDATLTGAATLIFGASANPGRTFLLLKLLMYVDTTVSF
jgi:hypothetical protein